MGYPVAIDVFALGELGILMVFYVLLFERSFDLKTTNNFDSSGQRMSKTQADVNFELRCLGLQGMGFRPAMGAMGAPMAGMAGLGMNLAGEGMVWWHEDSSNTREMICGDDDDDVWGNPTINRVDLQCAPNVNCNSFGLGT